MQTVYVQATRWDAATPVLEPERLVLLINRARNLGMRVVAWYLPDLGDVNDDMQRLAAIAALPVDGLAIDIESRKVADVDDRNQRLLDLSAWLREQMPGQVLSAIVLPPVVMEDVNPNYWPGFPWAGLAPYYDVWQPMSYWTNRLPEWRDAYVYTATNIDRVRERIGQPGAVVHTIGGIGDESTTLDVDNLVAAASDKGCIGGSIYDYRTTGADLWAGLQGFAPDTAGYLRSVRRTANSTSVGPLTMSTGCPADLASRLRSARAASTPFAGSGTSRSRLRRSTPYMPSSSARWRWT